MKTIECEACQRLGKCPSASPETARHEVLTSDAPETLAKWLVAILGADLGVSAVTQPCGLGGWRVITKTVVVTIRPQ